MIVSALLALREEARLSQTQMARAIHLSLRAYQQIKALTPLSSVGERHQVPAERASRNLAVDRERIDLAFPAIRREAMDLFALFRGEHLSTRAS